MGLKFRRGTTAQKSGSLAFGEPYVNTDLGTLQIGGATGDITLGASGTGSAGSFSGISGSSIDITGNAKIDGNLTLGGAITIGDQTTDTVNVVASLSSSLIPSVTNAFDLGSATKIWRDLYISTGSIKIVNPGTGTVVGTISSNSDGTQTFNTTINANGGILIGNSVQVSGPGLGIGGYGDRLMLGTSGSTGMAQQSLIFTNTSQSKAFTFPNANGTIALTSDLTAGYVTLGTTQTISGSKTFNSNNIFNGAQSITGSLLVSGSSYSFGNIEHHGTLTVNDISNSMTPLYIDIDGTVSVNGRALQVQKGLYFNHINIDPQFGGSGPGIYSSGTTIGGLVNGYSVDLHTGFYMTASVNEPLQRNVTFRFPINSASFYNGLNFTYPDKSGTFALTSDFTELTSSLIPATSNTYDLGSPTKIWRDIYVSTGSIKIINPGTGTVVGTITSNANGDINTGTQNISGSLNVTGSIIATQGITGQINATNGVISGSSQLSGTTITDLTITNLTVVNETASVLFSSGSNRFGDFSDDTHSFTGSVKISGSIVTIGASTATSFNGTINATNGVVSGSSQVIGILSSLNTYTGSNDTTNTTQNTSISNLNAATSSYETKGRGIVSGSAQIDGSLLGSNKTITVGSTSITLGGTATTIAGLTSVTSTAFVGALTGNASTVTTNANLTGNVTSVGNATTIASGVVTSDMIVDGTIVNGDINASAAIVDTKLATIATAGKVSNSATTATSANTVSAIVARDASGNFSAGTISAALTGNVTGNVSGTAATVTGAAQTTITSVGTLTALTVTGAITANGGVAVTGALTATGDITAYYSDGRLKENLQVIPNALEKVSKLTGYTYNTNALGKQLLNNENDNDIKVGIIAQDLQEVLPQAVKFAPFDRDAEGNSKSGENYLTVQYEKIVPLLIQAIKEQQTQIHSLTLEIEKLKESKGL